MREVYYSSSFRKDFKLAVKRGLNMSLIRKVMEKLENEIPLDETYKNHALTGSISVTLSATSNPIGC